MNRLTLVFALGLSGACADAPDRHHPRPGPSTDGATAAPCVGSAEMFELDGSPSLRLVIGSAKFDETDPTRMTERMVMRVDASPEYESWTYDGDTLAESVKIDRRGTSRITYDEHGRPASELFDAVNFLARETLTYTYDGDQLASIHSEQASYEDLDTTDLTRDETFVYGPDGRLTRRDIDYSFSEYGPYYQVDYTYPEQNVTREAWTRAPGSAYEDLETVVVRTQTLDADGHLLEQDEVQDYMYDTVAVNLRIVDTYEWEGDALVSHQTTTEDAATFTLLARTYDVDGRLEVERQEFEQVDPYIWAPPGHEMVWSYTCP